MAAPEALSIELRPSRIACAAIASVAIGAFGALLTVPAPPWAVLAAACALAAWAAERIRVVGLRRGPRAVRAVRLDSDDRIEVAFGSGRIVAGTLHRDSRAGPWLTSVAWRRERARWTRSILVLPDMLPADDFRRLRVLMRYGRAGG